VRCHLKKKIELAEKFGLFGADELEITIDLSGVAGKFIDHGYMKQIELAVEPGGQMHSPIDLNARSSAAQEEQRLRDSGDMDTKVDPKIPKGLEYVYDIPSQRVEGDIDVHAFVDVFPFELGALQKSLERLSTKVRALVTVGKLPETYIKLPDYLQAMANTYASKETDPEVVYKQYENLLTMCREVALSGCPIMLLPQAAPNVAGDASKTDIEVRIGFRTKEVVEFEKTIAPFIEIATRIRQENAKFCKEVKPMPPLFANYQPVAFGPNVFWHTRGEEGEEQILAHNNEVETVAIIKALPEFRRMFPGEMCSDQEFLTASKVDNSVHELGHTLIHTKDSAVTGRVGKSPVIEELKADSGNLKLIHMALESGAEVDVINQLRAKMGDICDYLKNKNPGSASGRKYFYGGATILRCLFDAGSVVEQEGGYVLKNHTEGVAAVAALADEVLELYKTGSVDRVQDYFEGTMKKSVEDPRVQQFIEKLKS
jgi:hypothetical protein